MATDLLLLTAYSTGYEIGRLGAGLLGIVLGVAALVFGIRMWVRRSATPPPTTGWPSATSPQEVPSAQIPGDANPFGSAPTQESPTTASPAPAAPAPARGRAWPIVLIVVGGLLTVGGLARTVPTLADDLNHQTVSIPQTAGEYQLMPQTSTIQTLLDSLKQQVPANSGLSNIQAGVYSSASDPQSRAFLVVGDVAGNPTSSDFWGAFQQGAQSQGAQSSLTPADTAGMPGEMRCGGMAVSQGSVSMCVWLDSDTFGIVVIPSPTGSPATAANTLRSAAES
jgi:hypothetical protein